MSEADAIARSREPATTESLARDLRALGLAPGMTVITHVSLSALGWVCGGPQALIAAIQEVLTDEGTLVMPAFSGGNSEPSLWENPPVPPEWWQTVRDHMPAYDPRATSTRALGITCELFRTMPGVKRSNHPALSFAAWGRYARAITMDHRIDSGTGDDSPLARIYDLHGHVLLLGVNHRSNSSLHLSETRANWPSRRIVENGAAVMIGEMRQWVTWQDLDFDSDDFAEIGRDYEDAASGALRVGAIGAGEGRLMPQRDIVDFGVEWMSQNRR
jgi:aminoglycoside 3-N-acetyltransferase